MFILKKGHQLGVYVPLRALFLVETGVGLILSLRICSLFRCFKKSKLPVTDEIMGTKYRIYVTAFGKSSLVVFPWM